MSLVSDGDSKTMSLILNEQPYGTEREDEVKKMDCVGHVQKEHGNCSSESQDSVPWTKA